MAAAFRLSSAVYTCLLVLIRFTHHPNGGPEYPTNYVHVWDAHTIRSKKRRR